MRSALPKVFAARCMSHRQVRGGFGRMRCPVRLLWGIEDQWIPVERGRELARRMPDCVLIELPNCRHLMQEDAPEAVLAAALTYFS